MGNGVKCPSFVFNSSSHTIRRGIKENVENIDHQGGKRERN